VTPSVVAWAIRESGYSISALALMLGLRDEVIVSWTEGARPDLSDFRRFAAAVQRPMAAFLLPKPPSATAPAVKFRHSKATPARELNPEERRRIREATRLQEVTSWIAREVGAAAPDVASFTTKDDPEQVGRVIRDRTGISVGTQLSWSSGANAVRAWREAVESCGVTVLMVPMGEESCRGFSMWDDRAPLIAVNTAWLPEARVFTLFHEFAHLVTRTNSVCAEDAPRRASDSDATERWCERVAASVIIPSESLNAVVAELSSGSPRWRADLSAAGRVANQFHVSRRAAALRLIEGHYATWSLFNSFPDHVDQPRKGGGGLGRTREELRRQRYGNRTMTMFREALRRDVMGPADVVDYLGVTPDALTSVPSVVAGGGDE